MSKIKEYSYKLTGNSALLMQNVHSMNKSRPKKISHADWERTDEFFQSKMYLEGKQIAFPPRVMKRLLIEAAKKAYTILGLKNGKASYKQLIESLVFIPEATRTNKKIEDCEYDEQFVTVSSSKVLRVRPRIEGWTAKLNIMVLDPSLLPLDILDEIVEFAGAFLGLGDYRPDYGRFSVKRVNK